MRVAHTHTARNLLENPRSNTGTDKVDFVELCTGLTVICGGKHLDKACCAYNLYDVQDQGYITRDDLDIFDEPSTIRSSMPGILGLNF